MIRVTDAPFNAKGDGVTNDRVAIQTAIDYAAANGGDTVVLTAGKTFKTSNLFLKSNVHLHFEDGAKLLQDDDPDAYVQPMPDGTYAPVELVMGHDVMDVAWGHSTYFNYPFIYACNVENVAITGKGTIEFVRGSSCDDTIHMVAVVFINTTHFELADFTIQKFNAYCMHIRKCAFGLCRNVTLREPTDGNGDGICLSNSHDIRVTGCDLTTSDDGILISTNHGDPREGYWHPRSQPSPTYNIEIDHNKARVTWDATKSMCFIVWGSGCNDPCDAEFSNIYIHDNQFHTMGTWTGNWVNGQFEFNGSCNAVKNVRFENNTVEMIQDNFYDLKVSDFVGFDSMTELQNGDFAHSDLYWIGVGNAGVTQQDGRACGYVEKADAKLYEGLKLIAGVTYTFTADVKAEAGASGRLFVREQMGYAPVVLKEFANTDWETVSVTFTVPATGNYRLGLEGMAEGRAYITTVSLEESK